jgi:hypothetical protein
MLTRDPVPHVVFLANLKARDAPNQFSATQNHAPANGRVVEVLRPRLEKRLARPRLGPRHGVGFRIQPDLKHELKIRGRHRSQRDF